MIFMRVRNGPFESGKSRIDTDQINREENYECGWREWGKKLIAGSNYRGRVLFLLLS